MQIPTPEAIRAARIAASLTQSEAADVLGVKLRAWQRWEADTGLSTHRAMRPALFELFLIKAKQQPTL